MYVRYVKRVLDLVFSLAALPLVIPLGVIVAVVVKATSQGPVVISVAACGRRGERFQQYRFRSILLKGAAREDGFDRLGGGGNEVRYSPVGRFLVLSGLNRLPQFLNVLRGDMSLIGPETLRLEQCSPEELSAMRAVSVRPGMFTIQEWPSFMASGQRAKLHGVEQQIAVALAYASYATIWLDLRILASSLGR